MKEWNTKALRKETKEALDFFAEQAWIPRQGWYLAGGTALALAAGHRVSLDLDFFTKRKTFRPEKVIVAMENSSWVTDIAEEGTVYGRLGDAKISFIAYPFFIPRFPCIPYGKIPVLQMQDIAVMKVIAISQRGRKRDFIDLYWYAHNREALFEVFKRLPDQYPEVAHDYHHILKSMVYFKDAERDEMPVVFFDVSWQKVKKFFQSEVPKLAKDLLL